ncbi:glycosyltransferase family 2 protein [Winogradskyella endarachnes]|uniref:Glycosyltransferase n=1 Tax=Winogradskyella endarachnes TaxID=2681965 RepID=A0A6L6U6M7_9FLAO|nr:glycosyltransferase family 2 protein [Winogradskyella endarachnes]MUU77881.1 glycosyltransferase [Winogradskyella endarachnes]
MKVSIITATYNSQSTIKTCMDSVLSQSYKDIEYIVVDGGSKDETLNYIVEQASKHQNIIYSSEPDKGIYDALNKGIAKATGDIIGFVHSDDFLASSTIIQTIVDAFKTENVDGVYGNLHYVALENTDKIIRNWISKPFNSSMLKKGWMPAHPTLYLKKSLYDKNGIFDLSYKIAADYDFILRIFKQGHLKFYFLPKTIVKMRVGGASNRSLKNIIQKSKEDYRAIKTNKTGNWVTIMVKNVSKLKQFIT